MDEVRERIRNARQEIGNFFHDGDKMRKTFRFSRKDLKPKRQDQQGLHEHQRPEYDHGDSIVTDSVHHSSGALGRYKRKLGNGISRMSVMISSIRLPSFHQHNRRSEESTLTTDTRAKSGSLSSFTSSTSSVFLGEDGPDEVHKSNTTSGPGGTNAAQFAPNISTLDRARAYFGKSMMGGHSSGSNYSNSSVESDRESASKKPQRNQQHSTKTHPSSDGSSQINTSNIKEQVPPVTRTRRAKTKGKANKVFLDVEKKPKSKSVVGPPPGLTFPRKFLRKPAKFVVDSETPDQNLPTRSIDV